MSDHAPLVVDGDAPPTTRDRAWVAHAACIGHNPDDFDHERARDDAARSAYPESTAVVGSTRWQPTPIKVRILGAPASTAPDMSWNDGTGNCVGMNPDLFFPKLGADTRPIVAICDGCSLFEPCREHGLRHETVGIWGGLTERQRRAERRRRNLTKTTP